MPRFYAISCCRYAYTLPYAIAFRRFMPPLPWWCYAYWLMPCAYAAPLRHCFIRCHAAAIYFDTYWCLSMLPPCHYCCWFRWLCRHAFYADAAAALPLLLCCQPVIRHIIADAVAAAIDITLLILLPYCRAMLTLPPCLRRCRHAMIRCYAVAADTTLPLMPFRHFDARCRRCCYDCRRYFAADITPCDAFHAMPLRFATLMLSAAAYRRCLLRRWYAARQSRWLRYYYAAICLCHAITCRRWRYMLCYHAMAMPYAA